MISPSLIILLAIGQEPGAFPATPEDLTLYRKALDPSQAVIKSRPVRFADLWANPGDFRGKRVEVSGRVARRFEAPSSQSLPARQELWLDQGGNLLCVVVPLGEAPVEFGREVRVAGVSFGLIEYRGRDARRMAPLVVGNRAIPGPVAVVSVVEGDASGLWTATAAAIVLVALAIARFWAKRPPRPRPDRGTCPDFLS